VTRLRQLREERQSQLPALFTQEALAHRLGVTVRAYQRWESGDRIPRTRHLKAVAKELGVSVAELGFPAPGTARSDNPD
jgi:transcriptional regulator with XRE-family HTH domain